MRLSFFTLQNFRAEICDNGGKSYFVNNFEEFSRESSGPEGKHCSFERSSASSP